MWFFMIKTCPFSTQSLNTPFRYTLLYVQTFWIMYFKISSTQSICYSCIFMSDALKGGRNVQKTNNKESVINHVYSLCCFKIISKNMTYTKHQRVRDFDQTHDLILSYMMNFTTLVGRGKKYLAYLVCELLGLITKINNARVF